MAVVEAIDNVDLLSGVISDIGQLGNWMQTLGIVVVLWIVFQIISLVINHNKWAILKKLDLDIRRLEYKIDRLKKSKRV